MKKILASMLALMLCVSMAACATKDTGSTSQSAASGSSDASTGGDDAGTPAPTGDIVNLKWVQVGNEMPKNYDAWKANLDQYLAEKIGVNLDVEVVSWSDWTTRRSAIVNTNEAYDILFTNNDTYPSDVRLGAFADISELVQTASPELYSYIPAMMWDAVKVDGKIYAVPTYKDSSQTEYFVMDKTVADKYEFDYANAKEFADFDELLQKVKDEEGITPFYVDSNTALGGLLGWYDQMGTGLPTMGVRYDDQERKVVAVFEQEDVMNDLKIVHNWFTRGIINSDAATLGEVPKYKFFGIAQGWSSAAQTVWGPAMEADAIALQWRDTVMSNETVRGSMSAISASSKNIEKALELLELVNTDSKVRDAMFYGLEGDDFDYDANGKVHKNKIEWPMAGYTQGSFFAVTPTDEVEFNQWDEVKELNENAKASVLLGVSFDTSEVENQLANCIEIYNRYKSEVLTGAVDPEQGVPAMMTEMRAAGFDEIVAAAQAAVDAQFN